MKKYLSLIALFLLISCAGKKGPAFTKIEKPKEDEAIVYFYRPSSYGFFVHYRVLDENKQQVAKIYSKTYSMYKTNKFGERKFTAKTEATSELNLNIEKNKVYFVKGNLKTGILVGRPKFEIIENQEEALKDLVKCKLSE